ncbi:DNA polymerase V subunit UmuC [compost metagenome]
MKGHAAAARHCGLFIKLSARDMSERVMSLIESMVPAAEVYSIDECFADLTGVQGNLTEFGRQVRAKVLKCTGIPVGVGIAPHQDAGKTGQPYREAPAGADGRRGRHLRPVQAGLGVVQHQCQGGLGGGRRMTAHLEAIGIRTATVLAKTDPWTLPRRSKRFAAAGCLASAWLN